MRLGVEQRIYYFTGSFKYSIKVSDSTIYEEIDIKTIADPAGAPYDILVVRLKKEKYITANIIMLAVLVFFLVICLREKIHFGSMAIIIGLVLSLSAFLRNYTGPSVLFHIDRDEIVILEKQRLAWNTIDRVALHRNAPEEAGFLKFYLKDGNVRTVKLESNMDRPVEMIAAYIVKYGEPPL
ncbi:MAG: hypothetical protein QM731_00765 [Chitinophagaceae bacterium]